MMWASTDDVVPPTETYDFSAETINELTTYGMPASAFPPHAIPCTMRTWSLHLQREWLHHSAVENPMEDGSSLPGTVDEQRALQIEAFQADILLKVKHCFHMYIVVRLSFVMINGVQQKF